MDERSRKEHLFLSFREDTHKTSFFSGSTPNRGGGGKTPEPFRRKKHFFCYDLKKNAQNLMQHKKK